MEAVLEHTDIFVTGAEQGLNTASDLNAEFHQKV